MCPPIRSFVVVTCICWTLFGYLSLVGLRSASAQEKPKFISGVNPALAHTNSEREVGIGAVVVWAGQLWTNTYGPHLPFGSSDKLRRIDTDWKMLEHPDSVGGTPANRMIHVESNQLLIGHHVIDAQGVVRTIDPKRAMPGRITANARHLQQPDRKVYYLTMENGIYEVDVTTREVNALIADPIDIHKSILPGYHGKGAYTGSGRVVVSNNGEPDQSSPSGCLATWDGTDWTIVARHQFTEVTGPGGLLGNQADDRVWAVGWDAKSVRLLLLENGQWSKFRLPKGSYTHDSNHGWNTEWPRIRQVTPELTLMHMHGMFFDFPQSFSQQNSAGLQPIGTYVKMPVDYAWFNDKLVIGKDDASRFDNQFVQQSQSNLWVGDVSELSQWGPKSGFGGVWLDDCFDAESISEPFLIRGFQHIHLHLHHRGRFAVPLSVQVDRSGTGDWKTIHQITVDKQTGYAHFIASQVDAQWLRLVAHGAADRLTAYLHLSSPTPSRSSQVNSLFAGLANISEPQPNPATLQLPSGKAMKLNVFTATDQFQVDGELLIQAVGADATDRSLRDRVAISAEERIGVDDRSAFVDFKDARGKLVRLRLPMGPKNFDETVGKIRHIREVVTERSMLNLHGTFYELPRPEPGNFLNFWQMKPISSHTKHIYDFCSWRGLLVCSGARADIQASNQVTHPQFGLWLGEVDDLWKFGKPVGVGGPWQDTTVKGGEASDPYLMLGYDDKSLVLSHRNSEPLSIDLEIDYLGTGQFVRYDTISVPPGLPLTFEFPRGFQTHWIRLVPQADANITARFHYR